jgi:hypothetical protein
MAQHPLTVADLENRPIEWQETEDPDFPYAAQVEGSRLRLRINDFPDEPLFSLFIEERHVADLDDWPGHWLR